MALCYKLIFKCVIQNILATMSILLEPYFSWNITLLAIKVYPGQRAGGIEADMMAANELNAHAYLQVKSNEYIFL